MKRIIITSILLIMSYCLIAQDKFEKNNELSLNAFNLVTQSFDLRYERLLGDANSVGLSSGVGYNNDFWDFQSVFFIAPAYRQYFSKNHKASGLFIEATTRFAYDKWRVHNFGDNWSEIHYERGWLLGAGFGLGLKLTANNGFTGVMKSGLGRNFLKEEGNLRNYFWPNFEISFGKRF